MEVKKVIIPSAFAGTPLYFALLHTSLFEVTVDYNGFFYKQTYRNRANILSPQGIKSLIVPVVGGRKYGVPLKNIKIDYSENWVHKHLKSLETYYYASPFYEIIIDDIKALYHKKFEYLWELNKAFTEYFLDLMTLNGNYTENFDEVVECNNYECVDLRKVYSPKRDYLSKFPMAKNPDYYKLYNPQPQEKLPELSIFDLVFNTGPEAGMLVRTMFPI